MAAPILERKVIEAAEQFALDMGAITRVDGAWNPAWLKARDKFISTLQGKKVTDGK